MTHFFATEPTAFEFLAYMVETYKVEISMNKDYDRCHVKDDDAFRYALTELELTGELKLTPTYAIGLPNESGELSVYLLPGITFYISYHDQEDKAKLRHDFNI